MRNVTTIDETLQTRINQLGLALSIVNPSEHPIVLDKLSEHFTDTDATSVQQLLAKPKSTAAAASAAGSSDIEFAGGGAGGHAGAHASKDASRESKDDPDEIPDGMEMCALRDLKSGKMLGFIIYHAPDDKKIPLFIAYTVSLQQEKGYGSILFAHAAALSLLQHRSRGIGMEPLNKAIPILEGKMAHGFFDKADIDNSEADCVLITPSGCKKVVAACLAKCVTIAKGAATDKKSSTAKHPRRITLPKYHLAYQRLMKCITSSVKDGTDHLDSFKILWERFSAAAQEARLDPFDADSALAQQSKQPALYEAAMERHQQHIANFLMDEAITGYLSFEEPVDKTSMQL